MFYFQGTRRPNFNNISDNIYSTYWQGHGSKLRKKLMEREEIFLNWINASSRVLSIGCGNSRLLLDLKTQKNCQVFGIDIEPTVVECLKNNGISAVCEDATKKDFNPLLLFDNVSHFDYIILSAFLEHLVLPESLLNNIKTLSDYFLISVPNSAFYRYRLGLLFNGRFFTQWALHPAEHLRYWSHIDFLDWLKALGFNILKVKSSNGPQKLKDIWPNMFGHQMCYLTKVNN